MEVDERSLFLHRRTQTYVLVMQGIFAAILVVDQASRIHLGLDYGPFATVTMESGRRHTFGLKIP